MVLLSSKQTKRLGGEGGEYPLKGGEGEPVKGEKSPLAQTLWGLVVSGGRKQF